MKSTMHLVFAAAVLLFISAGLRAEVSAPDAAQTASLEALLTSSDVVLSKDAASGVPVKLVEDPGKIEGGVVLRNDLGLTISAIAKAWKGNPISGLEQLPRDLAGGGGGGGGATDLLRNGEFTTDVSGWTAANAYGGEISFGPIAAPAGSSDGRFAVVHTGSGSVMQGSLEQRIRINSPANAAFLVRYNFVSTEWMGSSGGKYNDNAVITLRDNQSNEIRFGLFESVNGSTMSPVSGLPDVISGNGQNGGQTGWLTQSSALLFFDRGNYTVSIEVNDVSDGYYDSALLVDAVSLSQ